MFKKQRKKDAIEENDECEVKLGRHCQFLNDVINQFLFYVSKL